MEISNTNKESDKRAVAPGDAKERKDMPSVTFFELFRFMPYHDRLLFATGVFFAMLAGASLPAINIAFGEMMDNLAADTNVRELMTQPINILLVLGAVAFVSFGGSQYFIPLAAARLAKRLRSEYLNSLLMQDQAFFDEKGKSGELTLLFSDDIADLQAGLSVKFSELAQSTFQFVGGFAVAFYFGWQLTLILLAMTPLLSVSVWLLVSSASEDGVYGKEAYTHAAQIADESLSNMKTVSSLNGEPAAAKKYEENLQASENAAIAESLWKSLGLGLLFMIMFAMYGVGFYAGGVMIADSTDKALADYPIPAGMLNLSNPLTNKWAMQAAVANTACKKYESDPTTFSTCACALPWNILELESPDCGCGHGMGATGIKALSPCFTGGKTLMVFFSVLVGAFAMGSVGPAVSALEKAQSAAARIYHIIDLEPTIGKKKTVAEDGAAIQQSQSDHPKISGDIRLTNVQFSYPGKRVFKDITLDIKEGETVALVGGSGCGKSTVAKLLMRFYDPDSGTIEIGGKSLKDMDVDDLRANIGIVSQEPLLFDKTIEDNIRAGNPSATLEDIKEAAKDAQAHEFISNLPDGYQTSCGFKGKKLSGGQKQRVAIARALVRKPSILILDEATSALDNNAEKLVQGALDKLMASSQMTVVVIAHRLSTIRNADKIVVFGSKEGGLSTVQGSEIMEIGTHVELMVRENGLYKALVGPKATEVVASDDGDDSATIASPAAVAADPVELDELAVSKPRGESGASESIENVAVEKAPAVDDDNKKEMSKGEETKPEEYEVDTMRILKYNEPEYPIMVLGTLAAMGNGATMPCLAIAFAEMMTVFYKFDTAELRSGALNWSYFFYAIAAFQFVVHMLQDYTFSVAGERLATRLRVDLFKAILRQDIGWFEKAENALGVLTSCLAADVKLIRLASGQSFAGYLQVISALLTGLIIAFNASWQTALVCFAVTPLMSVSEYFQNEGIKTGDGQSRSKMDNAVAVMNEMITGIREVQAFSMEGEVVSIVDSEMVEYLTLSSDAVNSRATAQAFTQLIQMWTYALLFFIGGLFIENKVVEFDKFNEALWALMFAASGLGQAMSFLGDQAKAEVAKVKVFKVMDRIPEIDSQPWNEDGTPREAGKRAASSEDQAENKDLELGDDNAPLVVPADKFKGAIQFKGLHFHYPTRTAVKIFAGFDLSIKPGTTVALVGSSGSGKSTVISLVERFYDPTEKDKGGKILLDGYDLCKLDPRWVRENVGLVGQEPVLFEGSVRENILRGKPQATEEEVVAAAKAANAYDFIMKLPKGFDSDVGVGGKKISGGQKQRVAIARAIIKAPRILLLDEATSALDNESEKIVQASLDKLMSDKDAQRTTIVIAHRLSTIKSADCIFVLNNDGDGSTVVESGTHDELMGKNGMYKQLHDAYKEEGEE